MHTEYSLLNSEDTRVQVELDSLQYRYKLSTQSNEEKLKNAKNISELVSIKLDKMPDSVRNKRDGSFDLKFDPVSFRQQMPMMGDRNFLVKQALLQKTQ